MEARTKERIRFWVKQFDEPDDEHDFIVNLIVALVTCPIMSAVFWWAVYTTYLN